MRPRHDRTHPSSGTSGRRPTHLPASVAAVVPDPRTTVHDDGMERGLFPLQLLVAGTQAMLTLTLSGPEGAPATLSPLSQSHSDVMWAAWTPTPTVGAVRIAGPALTPS